MKDWLAANAFLLGLVLTAAALAFLGILTTRRFGIEAEGPVVLAAVVMTAALSRFVLKRIERR